MRRYEFPRPELAMRVLELVRTHSRPVLLPVQYAELIMDRFGGSKAHAYRLARVAADVLCLPPPDERFRSDEVCRRKTQASMAAVARASA